MNGLVNVRKIRTQSGRQGFARHWATWRPCYCSLDARRILTIRENDLETAGDEIPLKNATADRHHYSKDGYCVIIRTSEEQSSRDTALEIVLQCPNEETAKQWHNALQKCIDELAEIQRRNMQQAMTAFNSFMEERRALQERVGMSALSQENGVDPVYHHDSEVGKKHINFGRDMEPDNTTWVSAEFGELYSHALEQDNYEQRNTVVTEDDVEEEFGDDFVVVAEDDFTPNTTPANRSFWQSYRKSDSSKVQNLENASLIRNALWNTSGLLQTTKTVETDHAANHHSSVMLMSTTIPFWKLPLPRLRIVIMAVGTRGDVQPFALLGRRLQQDGHRVRLATHSCYRGYVESMGLEYYPLAGDPVKLSEFMVKSHGCILPTSGDVLREVPTNVLMLNDILISTWGACTEADPGDALHRPFTADAIISNPVTYGHIHCAEALGVPLHLMFPQPWVSTKAFPHPLACMSYNNTWTPENYMSYQLVDCMLWLSLEPFVNSFRRDVLGLQPIRRGEHGWNLINANKVPFVKMWSRHLVPKPKDWGSHIDVVGFFFDDESEDSQKSEFDPPSELASFLRDGSPAIFVGFGSMVIDDASSLVQVLLDCAALLNIRIIVQSGWSSISSERFLSMCQVAEHLAISSDFALDDVSGASSASAIAQYLREPESGSDSEGDLIFTTALSSGDVPPFDETSHRVELTHNSNNSNPYFSRLYDTKHSIDHVNLKITTESPKSSPASSPFQSPRSSNKSFRTMNSTPRSRWRASDALLIGACPHDWLFRHVAAVVHHGGAGTTAAGLRAGRPTMICPFFGDQHFWGQMVYRSGCGPEPCPVNKLSHEIVMQSFTTLLSSSVSSATQQIAEKINSEHGVDAAVKVFYKHLPLTSMVCDVSMYNGESRLAHVYCRTCKLKMCREASNAVHNREDMCNHIIVPCAYAKWGVQQPTDAVTGLFQGLGAVSHELAGGMVDVVYHPVSAVYTEGIGGLASGLVTGLKCLLYRPYMGGIVLAQKMKQGLSGLTSDAGLVLEKSGALSRGADDCYDDNRSDIIIDQPQSLPFTLNVNDTDDLVPPSDELVPSHGGYSTLLQRGDTTGISLKNLNDRNRNNAILSAYNSAIRVQESLKAIGGDESRIISFDAFSKLISGALHQPENKSTSATALLIEALSRKKQYMDFVDFSLFYLSTVNEGVKMWKNEPKRIIELD